MTISGFKILFYIISFIIPGFIIRAILERLAPMKRASGKQSRFLQLLTLGFVNSVGLFVAFRSKVLDPSAMKGALKDGSNLTRWLLIVLVLPVLLGFLFAALREWDRPKEVLESMGFSVLRGEPTAWDYRMHKINAGAPVVVTLSDGKVVGGDLGDDSYAASGKNGGDLYLEETYMLDQGQWTIYEGAPGIWIDGSEIKHVEFYPLEIAEDGDDERRRDEQQTVEENHGNGEAVE